MTMKRYSELARSPELEPHHQMQFSIIPSTLYTKKDDGIKKGLKCA